MQLQRKTDSREVTEFLKIKSFLLAGEFRRMSGDDEAFDFAHQPVRPECARTPLPVPRNGKTNHGVTYITALIWDACIRIKTLFVNLSVCDK